MQLFDEQLAFTPLGYEVQETKRWTRKLGLGWNVTGCTATECGASSGLAPLIDISLSQATDDSQSA